MDYKILLKKYIDHVGNAEGITFINTGLYKVRDNNSFTEEERIELEDINESLRNIAR